MSTQFETGFEDGDIIEADHVKQFAEPINELESGAAIFRVATNDSGAYSVDFRTSANSNGHNINSLTQGQAMIFKASHDSPASATLKVLRNDSPGYETHPLFLGDAQVGADDILQDQMVMVVFNNTTVPRFDVVGIASSDSLDDLSDVAISSPATGQVLRFNGTNFVNAALSAADIGAGTVSNTELGYLDGVTGAIQTQLDGKQEHDDALDEISSLTLTKGDILVHDGTEINKLDVGTSGQVLSVDSSEATGLKWVSGGGGGASDLDDLSDVAISSPTSGQVLRHNGTNFVNAALSAADIGSGTVSNTEFGYLDGVTSAIQTQLDDKQGLSAKGVANGYASLDSSGKVPTSQLPSSGGGVSDLDDLTDVAITSPTTGQVLRHNGTGFVNAGVQMGDVTGLQDELDDKQDVLSGTADVPGLDTALSGKASASHTHSASDITSGTIPVAQGGTGATSAGAARTNLGAQAQNSALDAIAGLSMAKGDILVHNGTQLTKMSPGTNGQLLSSDSAQSTGLGWVTGSGGGSPTGTANKVAYFNSSGALASTTNLSFNASNTQLGVGPTTPGSTLHVSSAETGSVNGSTGIVVSRGSDYVVMEAGLSGDSYVGTTGSGAFSLRTSNYPRFTLDSSGYCTRFPRIVGGQHLRSTGYASGAIDGTKGIELEISGGAEAVRMEVGTNNDSYVGTLGASSFHLRTSNTPRFSLNSSGYCTLFPRIVGGQQLKLTGYANGAVDGSKGIELEIPGWDSLKMEIGASDDSYLGTLGSSAFSLRTNNTPRFTINGSGKCTLFPTLSEQKIRLDFASSVVYNGSKGIEMVNGGHYLRMEVGNADDSYIGTATNSDFHLRRNDANLVALRSGHMALLNNTGLRFSEATSNGSNYVELKSPAVMSGNVSLTLPDTAGSANQYLKTDGSGNLSWGTGPAGSGATNALAFWSSSDTVSYNSGFSRSGSELVAPTLTTSLGQVFSNESYVTLYGNSGGAIRADFQSSKTYIPAVRNYGGGELMYWSSGEVVYQYSRGAHKEDIQPIELSMDDLMKWRPVEFKWKDNFGGNQDIGFVAEEVAAVYPRAATYDQPWDYTNEKTGEYAVDEDGMPKRLKGEQVAAGVKYEKAWIPMLAAVQSFYKRYQNDAAKHQDDLAKLEAKFEKRLATLEGARS